MMFRAQFFSWFYKQKRKRLIQKRAAEARRKNQLFDLEIVIEEGEKELKKWRDSSFNNILFSFDVPHNLQRKLYDLVFPSPLTFAAFQGDLNQLALWMDMGIGGGCFKTILKEERKGNKRPRILQMPYKGEPHLINAYGLPGKGVQAFTQTVGRSALWNYKRPLGISIGGHTAEEYWDVFLEIEEGLSQKSFVNRYYYEINISCPNTDKGRDLLNNPQQLEKLLLMMRHKTNKVIGVKLSPDQSNEDLVSFALRVQKVERTFINIGNTHFKTCEQVGLPAGSLSTSGGGFSGPALFKRTSEMMDLISPLGIPFIATGGITTADDVMVCLKKGATAVGLATALVTDPYRIVMINQALSKRAELFRGV